MPKITECPQPSREDLASQREFLAAQRVAIFGYDPAAEIFSNRIVQEGSALRSDHGVYVGESGIAFRYNNLITKCVHEGGTSPAATAGANGDDFFETLAYSRGASLVSMSGNSYWEDGDRAALRALDLEPYPHCRCAPIEPTIPSPVDLSRSFMLSDAPGIAAAALKAAKSAKPAPEPVLSIGGSEFNTAELLEALQLVRAKHAPAVKEPPRGLGIVAAIDHRCGRWNAED